MPDPTFTIVLQADPDDIDRVLNELGVEAEIIPGDTRTPDPTICALLDELAESAGAHDREHVAELRARLGCST